MAASTYTAGSAAPRAAGRPASGCANKLDGVAMWLVNGITGAFFASLERCSCIRISTYDDELGDESNPLIFAADHDGRRIRRRIIGKGKKARAFVDED